MMHRLLESIRTSSRNEATACRASAEDVREAYRLLFQRDPESLDVVEHHRAQNQDVWSLLRGLINSPEFMNRAADLVPPRTTLDWRALKSRFEQHDDVGTRPGFVTDFLGLHTRSEFLGSAAHREGRIDGLPVAGDAQCSICEWTAGLRGVELAGDDFVAVELGAGWGAWMAFLCRAARIRGALRTLAIGCEADPLHCQMMREHLDANGFTPDDYRLFEGAVGPRHGVALFPICEDSSNDWGLRPFFCDTEQEAAAIVADPASHADYRGFQFRGFNRVACHCLAEIVAGVDHVDILHIDVQGGEFELVGQNLELIRQHVGYLIIGTHSRAIEGGLIQLLSSSGWKLEVEEPCAFDIDHPRFSPRVDGVQGWRNLAKYP